MKPKQATGNPFYEGATPKEVARALLQPKATKADPEPPKAKPVEGNDAGGGLGGQATLARQ